MRKVTERDTKATILAALREAEKKIAALEKGKLDPVAETNAKKKTETINKANEIMEIKIEDKILDLSKSVTSLLHQISDRYRRTRRKICKPSKIPFRSKRRN